MNILEIVTNLFETLLFFIFVNNLLHLRNSKRQRIFQFTTLFMHFFAVSYLNFVSSSVTATFTITGIIELLFVIISCSDNIAKKTLITILFSVICAASDSLSILLPTAFKIDIAQLLYGGNFRIISIATYLFTITSFIYLFTFLLSTDVTFTILQQIISISFCVIGIIIINLICALTIKYSSYIAEYAYQDSMIVIDISTISLITLLLIYIEKLGKTQSRNIYLLEKDHQNKLEQEEYANLIRATSELRRIKHDMQIHLDVIHSFAVNNRNVDLIAYIEKYRNDLKSAPKLITTGNSAVDCIISVKLQEAKEKGIKTNYSIILPDTFPIEPIKTTSLLGNLWNNAIEACSYGASHNMDSIIRFEIKPYQDMTSIYIENSFFEYSASKEINRSERNRFEHGIGLNRIKEIITEYDGIIRIKKDDFQNVFSVNILIPNNEDNI